MTTLAFVVRRVTATMTMLFLLGCTPDNYSAIPIQTWQGIDVLVETRPSPPTPGMNEAWVILTDAGKRPVPDAIVYIRATGASEWKQGIQDGHTGVFRRAIHIAEPARQRVEIKLVRRGVEGLLEFSTAATGQL